jgi:hypothetical protein
LLANSLTEVKRIRSPSLAAARSRIFTSATSTAPILVWIVRTGPWHEAVAAVGKLQALHRGENRAPDRKIFVQWIVDLVGQGSPRKRSSESLVVGVGTEWAINNNRSIKSEFLYMTFERQGGIPQCDS